MPDGLQHVRERWDEVAGRKVRSLQAGLQHDGHVDVVLVPGLGALGYLVDTLAGCGAWARAHLLDVPGFGHRASRVCPAEIGAVADAVSGWVKEVVGGPVVLVGHSTGAQAALHVAAAQPELVRSLVLLGPTFPPEQRAAKGLFRAYVRNSRHEPPGLWPATVPDYLRGGPKALCRFVRSAQQDEPERVITEVSCPVLLARGEHDAFAPQPWVDRLTAAAPDGRSKEVAGAHTFPFRRGGMTAQLIAGFTSD
ncbi:pimeloyl-ACP methyl ester carboxylesterase [Lentzea atacamensis]|uniref:Pimeloyl-ACP methyl ester carboxylesterase n=1 Tax=Lentzea atacamensis TaxID=531938 RepID=A0A316HN28_9PSEU|nr:alpha/beta hydrolase [Lentzea atacamensis]PWK82144.1 pimeloyl-ACP methyl ester carboxylesterase [Lentzea atacamensis]